MLSSFVITLREGLEAALIVGLVLAAVKRAEALHLVRSVWIGVGAAVGVSLAAGVGFALTAGALPDRFGEIFEGVASLVAVGVLTFMIFWMRSQSRHLARDINDKVALAAGLGSGWALGVLAFAAVVREGLETVLFLYASFTASDAASATVGAVLGLLIAVALGWGIYAGSLTLDLRRFFFATGALLIVFAAGLLAYGLHELGEANVVPMLIEHVWDMNGVLDEEGTLGSLLKGLLGYNGNPSLLEVIAYWTYLLVVGSLFLGLPHRTRLADRPQEPVTQS